MGRAISMKGAFFAGVRVAGQLTYIPSHIKNGKEINSRVVIPIYCNSHRGTDKKTGEQGRTDEFKLVAWGKLADTCAKSLPKGKAIDVFAEPHSYMGRKFHADGSLFLDSAGQPIEEWKVAFTIMNIVFGEESAKTVAEEIQLGRRPINWNIANHPDFALWTQILQQRQAVSWDGRSNTFGYARVTVPQGPGIMLNLAPKAPQSGFVNTGFQPSQNLPGMIANVFGGFPPAAGGQQPLFDPMTGQRLAPATPQALFDQMTGQPLNANPAPTPGFPPANSGYATPQAPPMAGTGTSLF